MRQVITYATLLVALLAAAWFRWTAAPDASDGDKVVLLQGQPDQLKQVHWKTEDAEATISRKEDEHGSYLWVEYTKQETAKPLTPPGADATLPLPPPEKVAKTTVFKASDKGDELITSLAPMYALRKLEGVTGDKLAEIGLDAPTEELDLTYGDKTTALMIGGESYGTKDRYVQVKDSGDIYLVDDQLLKSLQYARTRLPDRDLWSFKDPEIASILVDNGTGKAEVTQKNPDDEKARQWVKADGTVDEQMTTWLDKALKLRGTTYVDEGAEDAPKDLQFRFSMRLTPSSPKAKAETLEVLQDGTDGDYYGRSEHTRGLLRLLRAPTRGVVEDVAGLVE